MTIRYAAFLGVLALAPAMVAQGVRQPDKVLYDTAIQDVQHGRYERARLTLQTLINTYDTSEFIPPAKFALADSWYREGGAKGLAQSEKECKDLIALFPNTPAAANAQQLLKKIQDAGKAK